MEIDYDYLRTGTAIGFRASPELCSNYLLKFCPDNIAVIKSRKILHKPPYECLQQTSYTCVSATACDIFTAKTAA